VASREKECSRQANVPASGVGGLLEPSHQQRASVVKQEHHRQEV